MKFGRRKGRNAVKLVQRNSGYTEAAAAPSAAALVEHQFVLFGGDHDGLAFVQLAFEDFLGQRVLEKSLHGPAHRPRAVLRVVALLHEKVLRLFVQFELDVLVPQAFDHLVDFQAQNLDEVGLGERAEHNHVVQPVQKFGTEGPLGLVQIRSRIFS